MEQQVSCPKCHSTQLSANKKGFSGKKAVIGGLLTGGIGLLAGTIGSNKVVITCLNCGNQFAPIAPAAPKYISMPPKPVMTEAQKEKNRVQGIKVFKFLLLPVIILWVVILMIPTGTTPQKEFTQAKIDSVIASIKRDSLYHVTKVDVSADSTINIHVKDPESSNTDTYFDNNYKLLKTGYFQEVAIYKGEKLQYSKGYHATPASP